MFFFLLDIFLILRSCFINSDILCKVSLWLSLIVLKGVVFMKYGIGCFFLGDVIFWLYRRLDLIISNFRFRFFFFVLFLKLLNFGKYVILLLIKSMRGSWECWFIFLMLVVRLLWNFSKWVYMYFCDIYIEVVNIMLFY